MLENIKDYIIVKNYIPKNICESLIQDITVNGVWEKHKWQNYGVVKDRPTFPPTELDVAEPPTAPAPPPPPDE